jgi:DNA-binding PadR family transcriptional regulator
MDVSDVLGGLGRFTEPALLILISLAGGAKHGYAIMQDVEDIADTRVGPGTLYGALARLESRGWIEALPSSDRRRPYQLTASGATALREHLNSVEQLAQAGLHRLANI